MIQIDAYLNAEYVTDDELQRARIRLAIRRIIDQVHILATEKAKTHMPWFAVGAGGAFSVTVDKESILEVNNLIK